MKYEDLMDVQTACNQAMHLAGYRRIESQEEQMNGTFSLLAKRDWEVWDYSFNVTN